MLESNKEDPVIYEQVWHNMAMEAKKTKRTKTEEKPAMTVVAGSGGLLAPQVPPQSIKQLQLTKTLSDEGKSVVDIAIQMKKTENWVRASLLIMQKLPEKVHQAIANRQLSRTAALQLLLVPKANLDAVVDGAIQLSETEGKL